MNNYLPLWLSCWAFVEAAAGESVVASCKTLSDVARKIVMDHYYNIIITDFHLTLKKKYFWIPWVFL